jgi:hypothetical protein
MVDDETVLKRQYAAARAAIDAAYRQGHVLMVMVFSDGEEPSVFGVEGVPIREMLDWAASTARELTPEQSLIVA